MNVKSREREPSYLVREELIILSGSYNGGPRRRRFASPAKHPMRRDRGGQAGGVDRVPACDD